LEEREEGGQAEKEEMRRGIETIQERCKEAFDEQVRVLHRLELTRGETGNGC
jgi:hypothetical protein